jgi:hypothetical protein
LIPPNLNIAISSLLPWLPGTKKSAARHVK